MWWPQAFWSAPQSCIGIAADSSRQRRSWSIPVQGRGLSQFCISCPLRGLILRVSGIETQPWILGGSSPHFTRISDWVSSRIVHSRSGLPQPLSLRLPLAHILPQSFCHSIVSGKAATDCVTYVSFFNDYSGTHDSDPANDLAQFRSMAGVGGGFPGLDV
jgi:hypothetical protein